MVMPGRCGCDIETPLCQQRQEMLVSQGRSVAELKQEKSGDKSENFIVKELDGPGREEN